MPNDRTTTMTTRPFAYAPLYQRTSRPRRDLWPLALCVLFSVLITSLAALKSWLHIERGEHASYSSMPSQPSSPAASGDSRRFSLADEGFTQPR